MESAALCRKPTFFENRRSLLDGRSGLQRDHRAERDHTADKIYRRALASFARSPTPETVEHFLDLRHETNERVGRRWWVLGELDRARWRSLVGILNEILYDKKEGLARSLFKEVWS